MSHEQDVIGEGPAELQWRWNGDNVRGNYGIIFILLHWGGEELKEVEKKTFKQYKKKQGNVLSTDNKRPILCAASR